MDVENVLATNILYPGKEIEFRELLAKLPNQDPESIVIDSLNETDYFEIFVERSRKFELVRETASKIPDTYIRRVVTAEDFQTTETKIAEKTFVEKDFHGAMLYGEPGSGNSLLLTSIANQIKQNHPKSLVVYISIPEFFQEFKAILKTTQIYENPQKLIVCYTCPSKIASAVLEKLVEEYAISLALIFDGLDEISSSNQNQFRNFLNQLIQNNANKLQVFISAHHPKQLVAESNTLSLKTFHVLPISEEEQLSLICQIWQQSLPMVDQPRLYTFAKLCLENFQTSCCPKDQQKIGAPLLCTLLADAFLKEAKLYLNIENKMIHGPLLDRVNSLFALYKKYFDAKRATNDFKDKVNLKNKKLLYTYKALQMVCPDTAQVYADYAKLFQTTIQFCIATGKSDSGKNLPKVHKSLAEYLVSELFAELLTNPTMALYKHVNHKNILIEKLVFSILLSTDFTPFARVLTKFTPIQGQAPSVGQLNLPRFAKENTAYFLDKQLASRNFFHFDHFVVQDFFDCISPENLLTILQCCFSSGFKNILDFIKTLLQRAQFHQLESYRVYFTGESSKTETQESLFRQCMLLCSAVQNSKAMVEECFEFFLNCFATNLDITCEKFPLWMYTPLHAAIEKADKMAAVFFAHKISLDNRSLIYYAVYQTDKDSLEVAQKKGEILAVLLNQSRNLVNETSYDLKGNFYNGPLVAGGIHAILIKTLLKYGANPQALVNGKTFVHQAVEYMTADEFHELLVNILEYAEAMGIFKASEEKWESVLHKIFGCCKNLRVDTAELLVTKTGADANAKDQEGNNLLLSAVNGKQGLFVILVLIDRGAEVKVVNQDGRTALHLSAINRDKELLQYFLNCELPVNAIDIQNRSALHYSAGNWDLVKILLEKGADIWLVDGQGNTVVHLAAKAMDCAMFAEFVTYCRRNENVQPILQMKNSSGKTPLEIPEQNELF